MRCEGTFSTLRASRGTYLDPLQRPVGIDKVWVHGHLVLDHGALIVPQKPFPGRVLTSPVHAAA